MALNGGPSLLGLRKSPRGSRLASSPRFSPVAGFAVFDQLEVDWGEWQRSAGHRIRADAGSGPPDSQLFPVLVPCHPLCRRSFAGDPAPRPARAAVVPETGAKAPEQTRVQACSRRSNPPPPDTAFPPIRGEIC